MSIRGLLWTIVLFVISAVGVFCNDSTDAAGKRDPNSPEQEAENEVNVGTDTDDFYGDGGSDLDSDADSDTDADSDGDADGGVGPGSDMGPGTQNQYDPDVDNSNGVGINDKGWLELNTKQTTLDYLWVANSGEGTVSKIDTATVQEVGRYLTGLDADRADPSRTSVDLAGDVFVGVRNLFYGTDHAPSSLTKIAGADERCIDRNQNGKIDTSTGANDVYPRSTGGDVPVGHSTDECVLWTRGFDDDRDPDSVTTQFQCHGLRAVTATAETGENFEHNGHVWVGCFNEKAVYKLNGTTGELLKQYQLPHCQPYGALMGKNDRLWLSCRGGSSVMLPIFVEAVQGVAWVNTNTGKENYMANTASNPYGIAMDEGGDVWVTDMGGQVIKFMPGAPVGSASKTLGVDDSNRGIAVDSDGFIWMITTSGDSKVYMLDSSSFPNSNSIIDSFYLGDDDVGGPVHAYNGVGVAVDFNGNVWGISRNEGETNGYATRLEVDRTGAVPTVVGKQIIQVGYEPYSYSDMIGYHLRHFTTKEGWYRQTFEVCDDHSTKWKQISFKADTPGGTSFIIRARTADHVVDLENAEWITIVEVPSDTSPKDLPDTLPEGHYIELEARLYTEEDGITPSIGKIGFTFDCTVPVVY